MSNEILIVENLHKYFHSGGTILKVLQGIDLKVLKGSIVTITGESGVGKSTLLSLIGGIDTPTDGKIKIKGLDITELNEEELSKFRAETLGFVFQFHFLLPELTALENLFVPFLIKGYKNRNNFYKKSIELLEEVGLEKRWHHKPSELSGGECQRVALARALVKNPEIVIADEPTGNLDEKNSKVVIKLIKNLNKKYGNTFIIASHNLEFTKISDESYVIKNGKIYKL